MTENQTITCRAAICWAPKKPLTIETIQVLPPRAGEVRIKILNNSICGTDLHGYHGTLPCFLNIKYPCILGHEAVGIVECIGPNVKSVKVNDLVIPCFLAQCHQCQFCQTSKTNMCLMRRFDETAMMDGTSRYLHNGKEIHHFVGVSSLSEYSVVAEVQVAKVNPDAPLDSVCLIGCGFPTGFGTAVNVGNIEKGSSVAIWGLGTIGLAAVCGAKKCGASTIVGIDVNPKKEGLALKFGCTDFINPTKLNGAKINEVLAGMSDGLGIDVAIDSSGSSDAIRDAMDSIKVGYGRLVLTGIGKKKLDLEIFDFLVGRTVVGIGFGGFRSRDDIPKLVDQLIDGEIDLDGFITAKLPLDEVNKAFEMLASGDSLRTVINLNLK